MEFLSNNRAAGLALMAGVALIFIASLVSVGGLSVDAVNYSDFGATMDMLMDNSGMHQAAGILFMLAVILMAFGAASLLRLSHRHTLADLGLRLGVGVMLFAWGVYIVQLGMQFVVIEAGGEDGAASTVLALITGVHFGFIALGALGSFLIGVGVAARFEGVNLFVIAGYGLALMGVAEAANLVISSVSDVDLGLLLTINNVLLALGGLWLFIIGFGIYRGEPALTPQGAEE